MPFISEPLKPEGAPQVLAWMDAQAVETLYLSAITLAQLLFGIAVLPDGQRKDRLRQRLDASVLPVFADRILPFGTQAASAYARLRSGARAAGRGLPTVDGYIAAIALAHGLAVATRDTGPFEAAGLTVINPWRV